MGLEFKRRGKDLCLTLSGDLDEYTARSLKAEADRLIEARGFSTVTLDMGGVTFMDSTGLGFVLGRYKKLRGMRVEMLLKNVPPQVDKVFRTSGVYSLIPIVED